MSDDKKIRKGLPPKRNPAGYQVQADIIIPKGTILREDTGRPGTFSAAAAHGAFSVADEVAAQIPRYYKRVIA